MCAALVPFKPSVADVLNGIFDPIWTFLIIYFCFRKEESQLHSLDYLEALKEVFEEEFVFIEYVVNVIDNKRFAEPHESLLDVVAAVIKKKPSTKPVIIISIPLPHFIQNDGQ